MKLKMIINNKVMYIKSHTKYSLLGGIMNDPIIHFMLDDAHIMATCYEKDFTKTLLNYIVDYVFGRTDVINFYHDLHDIVEVERVSELHDKWKITTIGDNDRYIDRECNSDDLLKTIKWVMRSANSNFELVNYQQYGHMKHIL